jgi:hypothetical protein
VSGMDGTRRGRLKATRAESCAAERSSGNSIHTSSAREREIGMGGNERPCRTIPFTMSVGPPR